MTVAVPSHIPGQLVPDETTVAVTGVPGSVTVTLALEVHPAESVIAQLNVPAQSPTAVAFV